MLTEFHIGIDDTDSTSGGCTTYVGTLIFQKLCDRGIVPLDFPWLVRLNPNIPWKTRGNGAVAIHLKIEPAVIDEAVRASLDIVEASTDLSAPDVDPAVVYLKGPVPDILQEYYQRALQEVLSVAEARTIGGKIGADIHLIKGTRGIVGSLAALGAGLDREA
ncbi:MAG TPA: tRNA(Ile2) 2-agmatinylcytidine synthetase, partial [Candidatus Bathyarchaeia archaeon]|nr:tRNA(Ile2) 2-agmatinylcytidine synthetase [Candidatus Bathyarchaeia archaeon]